MTYELSDEIVDTIEYVQTNFGIAPDPNELSLIIIGLSRGDVDRKLTKLQLSGRLRKRGNFWDINQKKRRACDE